MLGHERIKAYGLVASALMAATLTFSVKALDSLSIQVEPLHYEVISDEEIHTYFQEKEQTKNLSVNGFVQECIQGTIEKAESKVNEFTYEESQLLMHLAEAEAGNQGEDGMWLVMSVVMNRVNDPDWPDNITDVIYQKNQFSPVSDGRLNKVELSTEVHTALARIEKGEVAPEIIGFEVKDSNELEKYFRAVFGYRDHVFYVKKSRSGARGI